MYEVGDWIEYIDYQNTIYVNEIIKRKVVKHIFKANEYMYWVRLECSSHILNCDRKNQKAELIKNEDVIRKVIK